MVERETDTFMGHPWIVYFGRKVVVLFHTFKYAYFYFRFHIVGIDSLINFSVYIYILNRISGVMVSGENNLIFDEITTRSAYY
jgi:hypothetical protein